jgi:hypothetical protein
MKNGMEIEMDEITISTIEKAQEFIKNTFAAALVGKNVIFTENIGIVLHIVDLSIGKISYNVYGIKEQEEELMNAVEASFTLPQQFGPIIENN